MQESWEEKGNKSILLILRGFDSPTDYDGQTDTSRDIHTFQRIKIQEEYYDVGLWSEEAEA